MTAATRKPGKPTKAEQAARNDAVAKAGGPAPPRTSGHGFESLVGQSQATEALQRALCRNRLPHAVLLHGPAGVGKATCAGILAQALNCPESGPADACGHCASCAKVERGLHPDVLWVEREKSRKEIRLVQVTPRKKSNEPPPPHEPIVRWVGYRPYEGNRRVVIVDNAHEMNPAAQNAFLKTLEEPPSSSTLVLVTPAPGSLLPTIRSRCQSLRFRPLPLGLMREHLEATGLSSDEARLRTSLAPGSLGRAIDLDLQEYGDRRDVAEAAVQDARQGGAALLASAETLLAAGAGERKIDQAVSAIGAVRDILRDLLVLNAGDDRGAVVNLDRVDEWRAWATSFEPDAIVDALNAVQRADDSLRSPLQPNARLTIEEALIGVGAALRGEAR